MAKKHKEELRTISKLQDKQQEYHDFILYWVHEVKTPVVASKMLINNPDLNDTETIFKQIDEELTTIDKLVMQALLFFTTRYILKRLFYSGAKSWSSSARIGQTSF